MSKDYDLVNHLEGKSLSMIHASADIPSAIREVILEVKAFTKKQRYVFCSYNFYDPYSPNKGKYTFAKGSRYKVLDEDDNYITLRDKDHKPYRFAKNQESSWDISWDREKPTVLLFSKTFRELKEKELKNTV